MSDYLQNLSVEILGGAVVALGSLWFLTKYSTLFGKPKLRLLIKQNGKYSEYIIFTKNDERFKANFDISIKNTGNKSLSEKHGFWHLYVPGGEFNFKYTAGTVDFVDNIHMRNVIEFPIFPNGILDLNTGFEISFNEEVKEEIKMYGWINSEYGNFPKGVALNSDGLVAFSTLQSIPVKFE